MNTTFVARGRRRMLAPAAPAFLLHAALGATLLLAALGAAAPALAQSRDLQQMQDRMDRLERELSTLQRQAYGGQAPASGSPYAPAPLAGSAGGTPASPAEAARLEVRLSELEKVLATLTGRVEELTFQNQSLQNRLDKLVTDVDFRLRTLEGGARPPGDQAAGVPASPSPAQSPMAQALMGQQPAAAMPSAGAVPPAPVPAPGGRTALTMSAAPPPGAQPPGAQPPGAAPPAALTPSVAPQSGVLGTMPASELAAAQRTLAAVPPPPQAAAAPAMPPAASAAQPAAAVAPGAALPPGSAKDQYEYAYGLLRQRNFPEAEAAFREFVTLHKNDELSGNAYYWLGETHYVRRQFEPAAVAFLEGARSYPKGSKAADNLLKLGMSLAGLNRQKEACTTFAKLGQEFPDAPNNLKAVADNERRKISCQG